MSQKEKGRRHGEKRRGRVKEKERREEARQKREKVIKKKIIIIIRAFSSNVLKMLNTLFFAFLTPQIIKTHLYQGCQI